MGSWVDPGTVSRRNLLAELEEGLRSATTRSRGRIFTAIADLFLQHASTLGGELVDLFDEIFLRQIPGVDTGTLAAVSERLAPIANAPPRLVRRMARHGVGAIAGPMLTHAPGLTVPDLIALAETGSEAHRLAIAARAAIDELLAAVLIEFGEQPVMNRLALNAGARFRIADFGAMLARASADDRARVRTNMTVSVMKFGGGLAGRCTMIDISPGGAKLTFEAPVNVPEMFTLEITPAECKQIACRVVWRRGPMIGLRFTASLVALWDPASGEAAKDSA